MTRPQFDLFKLRNLRWLCLRNCIPPLSLGVDSKFAVENRAIEVERFRPVVTARGEISTKLFELDVTTGCNLVPFHLLRVGTTIAASLSTPLLLVLSAVVGARLF